MRNDVAVVVLAGGKGSRIGGGKPLRRVAGERMIDRALRAAGTWSDLVAVAVRDAVQVQWVNAPVIEDEPNIGGPFAGLASAVRLGVEANREFVLTIPADMPFLPDDLLERLLSAISDSGCAIASSGGHLHPVCGLWRTSAAGDISNYLAGQRRSLKGFASLIGFSEVEWPCDPFDPFFNINTADDLAEAERRTAD